MKRRIFALTAVLLLMLAFLLLTGCTVNEALLYENSFDELDISTRYSNVAYLIEQGRYDKTLVWTLNAAKEDLLSIVPKNRRLETINGLFISCGDELLAARESLEKGDAAAAEGHLIDARHLYNRANRGLDRYKAAFTRNAHNEKEYAENYSEEPAE